MIYVKCEEEVPILLFDAIARRDIYNHDYVRARDRPLIMISKYHRCLPP